MVHMASIVIQLQHSTMDDHKATLHYPIHDYLGPQSMTNAHFDIFIEPLISELLNLWTTSIETCDACT